MVQEQLKVFTGSGKNIQNQVNAFLKENANDIEVISFQVVDNPVSGTKSTAGHHVFYLLYRSTTKGRQKLSNKVGNKLRNTAWRDI